jgi:hypothetical protein
MTMGSLLIRPLHVQMGRKLGKGLNSLGILPPEHCRIREICWDGTMDAVDPPIVLKGLLVAVATGQERGEFVSGLGTVVNDPRWPYPPFVLPWSTAHSPECDRNGGGSCARCEARCALEDIRTHAPKALGALEAYHEAGHAVVGFNLGLEIKEATLIPYGSGWGWVLFRYFEEFNITFVQHQPQLGVRGEPTRWTHDAGASLRPHHRRIGGIPSRRHGIAR